MHVYGLPSELMVAILQCVRLASSDTYVQDIFNLCCVRPFHPVATDALYYDPGYIIRQRHQGYFSIYHLACLVKTVIRNPRLGALIRHFTFDLFYQYSDPFHMSPEDTAFFMRHSYFREPPDTESPDCSPTLPALLLARCPNVTTAHFAPHDILARFMTLFSNDQKLLWWPSVFPRHPFLKTLTISFKDDSAYELADIVCLLRLDTLENLSLLHLDLTKTEDVLDVQIRGMLQENMCPVKRLQLDGAIIHAEVLACILPCFAELEEFLFRDGRNLEIIVAAIMYLPVDERLKFFRCPPLLDLMQKHKRTLRRLTITDDETFVLPLLNKFCHFHNGSLAAMTFCVGVGFLHAAGPHIVTLTPQGVQKLIILFPSSIDRVILKHFFSDAGAFATLAQNLLHLKEIHLQTSNRRLDYECVLSHFNESEILDKIPRRRLLVRMTSRRLKDHVIMEQVLLTPALS